MSDRCPQCKHKHWDCRCSPRKDSVDQPKIPTLVVLPSGRAVNVAGVLDAARDPQNDDFYNVTIVAPFGTHSLRFTGEDADAMEQAVRSFAMYVLRPKDAPPALVVPGKTILQ